MSRVGVRDEEVRNRTDSASGPVSGHNEEALRVNAVNPRAEVNTYVDVSGRSSAYFQTGHGRPGPPMTTTSVNPRPPKLTAVQRRPYPSRRPPWAIDSEATSDAASPRRSRRSPASSCCKLYLPGHTLPGGACTGSSSPDGNGWATSAGRRHSMLGRSGESLTNRRYIPGI
jgi:hypothetical protein